LPITKIFSTHIASIEVAGEILQMQSVAADLDLHGYVFLPRHLQGEMSEEVAAGFGEMMTPWEGGLVQRLIPRATSTPNTYSGNFGLNPFPFHTDLAQWPAPPRYLMLRCVRGYRDVPTLIVDGHVLLQRLGTEALSRAVVRPRRPQAGQLRLLRLLQREASESLLRWDAVYLRPASRIGELAFVEIARCLRDASPKPLVMAEDGDTVIIDNWRMLHARPAIPRNRLDRCLERVYLRSLN